MALDYSTKRQVSRNRPKRRPIGRYLLLAFAGVSVVYGLGIATGWLLFGRDGKQAPQAAAPPLPATTAKQAAVKAPAGPAAIPTGPGTAAEGTNLTFFNTLPKGEKNIMGSGINPPYEARPVPAGHSTTQAATADRTPQPAPKTEKAQAPPGSADKPKTRQTAETKPSADAEKPQDSKPVSKEKEGYAVQVASYRDRKEAEDMKATLEQKGFSVRISESKVQGKGIRYRVRVGTGLRREDANRLATKLGGNVMVVPE